MNEFISIYRANKEDIESFVISTLKNNDSIKDDDVTHYRQNFEHFPSMELLYITDAKCKQISPNIYRNKMIESAKEKDRAYLASRLINKGDNFSISEPYISSATGNICITVMQKENNQHIFIDFKLSELLARLGMIELHQHFDNFTKHFYTLIGFSLMFFAFLAIGYAFFSFITHLIDGGFTLDTLFKPIVAITLGLAIFDLAKTILEREVYYKSYSKKNEDNMVLTKFAIAIIIALSIEALMVVFKIAIHDYSNMIYGLYLITGVGIVITSLGLYNFLSSKKKL